VRGDHYLTRCILSLLLTGVAVIGLSGCGKEPPVQVNHAEMQETAATVERIAVKSIDFDGDLYLKDVCRDTLSELPFKRFESSDFIYDSPLPAQVSGAYYEVRAWDVPGAETVYEEIQATIFRDVKIVFGSSKAAPNFSLPNWDKAFAVSNYPFSETRELRYTDFFDVGIFPFLPLAGIPYHETSESELPDTGGSNFSLNFISVLNFLASRGVSELGRDIKQEERDEARNIRLATTGSRFERWHTISKADLMALRRIPLDERPSISSAGSYILISLGKPTQFIAAIDVKNDAVGLRACNSGQLRD
jgi:hypothetical protein